MILLMLKEEVVLFEKQVHFVLKVEMMPKEQVWINYVKDRIECKYLISDGFCWSFVFSRWSLK